MDASEDAQKNGDLQAQELEIVTYLLRFFQNMPDESKRRVIETVSRFFDLKATTSGGFHFSGVSWKRGWALFCWRAA